MQPFRTPNRSSLRAALLAAALCFASAAQAGPPLLCHPFDTGGAASLPWGTGGWNTIDRRYDTARLSADTLHLLGAGVPVIARMETLRRAAIYASADGAHVRELAASLDARIAAAANPQAKALALFDAGYFAETLEEIARLRDYDMPGVGKADIAAIRAVLAKGDGSARIARALAMRRGDASMRFAAALVASADRRDRDYEAYARVARAGASSDRLLALNLGQITR